MFRTQTENKGRSPKLDAPPYDPSLWEGRDCAFITTLKDIYHEQERMERQLRLETPIEGSPGIPLPVASHTQLVGRPSTWWGKLLVRFFPHYYARQALASLGFDRMTKDELLNRMHFALRAGDTDLSALIARELARRRACIYEGGDGENIRNNTRESVPLAGVRMRTETNNMRTRLSGGVGGRLSGGTSSPRGSGRLSTDSSFAVPEILLQRGMGNGGGVGGGGGRIAMDFWRE